MKLTRHLKFFLFLGMSIATTAHAQLMRIGAGSFTAAASTITFSEHAAGTLNPAYSLATASLGTVDVSFGSHFVGQTRIGSFPVTLSGAPEGPLQLDLGGGNAFITQDRANPGSPVLTGAPTFNGPISVLFSTPVAAVALDGGVFNAIGGTSIEAFDDDGTSLGIVRNDSLGIEFFGLAAATGKNVISGISFYITGAELAGFAIDNLTFGSAAELTRPAGEDITPAPEPSTYAAAAGLMLGLATLVRRIKRPRSTPRA